MRPRSFERDVLLTAAQQITRLAPDGSHVGASFRALAVRSSMSLDKAQLTLENMARAGELMVVGKGREPGANRPVNLYVVSPNARAPRACAAELAGVFRRWVSAT